MKGQFTARQMKLIEDIRALSIMALRVTAEESWKRNKPHMTSKEFVGSLSKEQRRAFIDMLRQFSEKGVLNRR